MPELPEVETVRKGLEKELTNVQIKDVRCHYLKIVQGNYQEFSKSIKNSKIIELKRHGKYLFVQLDNDKTIVIHLRMTGQLFFVEINSKPDKHTHLELYFQKLNQKLIYRDIRKFGRIELIESTDIDTYLAKRKLAPDALLIKPKEFAKNLLKRKKILKAALLDQSVIAGLGNIYVDEVLLRSKLSPKKMSSALTYEQIETLLVVIKKVLKEAILKKGTSFSDYVNSYGEKGKFQLSLKAYQQTGKPCVHCATAIVKEKLAGRSTHYCPECQK